MNKAIFLDRDGTINVEKQYLYKSEDFEFIHKAIDGMKLLQNAGFKLFVITNQSGIARGFFTEDEFHKLNDWMLKELRKNNVNISKVYYCPHLNNAKIEEYRIKCNCRKPLLGMYEKAIDEFSINLAESYAIGDKLRDCAICECTACRGFLIGKNEKPDVIDGVKFGRIKNVVYANSLYDCAIKIVSDTNRG